MFNLKKKNFYKKKFKNKNENNCNQFLTVFIIFQKYRK